MELDKIIMQISLQEGIYATEAYINWLGYEALGYTQAELINYYKKNRGVNYEYASKSI